MRLQSASLVVAVADLGGVRFCCARMKLWIGAELDADVADAFREVRNRVEKAVNAVIASKDFELPLNGWDCIAIVRGDDSFAERVRYSPRTREMDFRLRIDHSAFSTATPRERKSMLFSMLRRSLALLPKKLPSAKRLHELESDLRTAEASE